MSNILVNLVQLGFLGFAVAIMYLAFKLLQDLVKGTGQNPQTLKLKIISVGLFLGLSGVVLGLGIWYSLKDPNRPITIVVDLSPNEEAMKQKLKVITGTQQHDFAATRELSIRNQSRLTFDINAVVNDLRTARTNAELAAGLQAQLDKWIKSTVETPEADSANDEQGI